MIVHWPWDGLACDPAAMIGNNILYNYQYQFVNTKETTKVPTEAKQYIVVGPSGTAYPANKHTNLSSAEAEATRLARKYSGEEFTIYQTTKSFRVQDKPIEVTVFV